MTQLLTPEAAQDVLRQSREADAAEARAHVRETARWRRWTGALMWLALVLHAYAAARALFFFADLGAGALTEGDGAALSLALGAADRAFMILTAFALIGFPLKCAAFQWGPMEGRAIFTSRPPRRPNRP